MIMKTFITKLRLSVKPVDKQETFIKKIKWFEPADSITWGEPNQYIINSVDVADTMQYASFSGLTSAAAEIGASFQNVTRALQQATLSAEELNAGLSQLQQVSYLDDAARESIVAQSHESILSTSEIIERLLHERLRGNLL